MTPEMPVQPKKRSRTWIFIVVPFLAIATIISYSNIRRENAIIEHPQPGDYFVFRGLLGSRDQPFKLKAIRNDTMEFYIPKYELLNFKPNRSERRVYQLDSEGKLFDSTSTLKMAKSTVDSLRKNSDLSVQWLNNRSIYLKNVFGSSRRNAVESNVTSQH